MIINDAKNKTIDLLLGDQNSNANFYASLFERYNYSDAELVPISPILMGSVNEKNKIVITEEAYNNLLKIRNITARTDNEVAYFIFGEEKTDGTVYLDTVVSTFESSDRLAANFQGITPILNQYVNEINNGEYDNGFKQVICHGHTHGSSPVCDNFSFGDLISYVEFNDAHPLFKNRQIETIGMLMPPCGDFNFIMYENNPQYEGYYIFPDVYLEKQDKTLTSLPSYELGNYIFNENNQNLR